MSVFCYHSPLRLGMAQGLFHLSWPSSTFIHGYPVAARLHLIPLCLVPVVQLWHQNTKRHQQIQNWPMRFLLKSFHNSILNQTYTLTSWGQRFPHLSGDLSWPAASFEKRYLLSCPAQTSQTTTHGQRPLFYYLPVPRRIWLHTFETAPAVVGVCS